MSSNSLKLNGDRTENILLSPETLRDGLGPSLSMFSLLGSQVAPQPKTNILWGLLDPDLSFSSQIGAVAKSLHFQLHRLILPLLLAGAHAVVVGALVNLKLVYGNALFLGLLCTNFQNCRRCRTPLNGSFFTFLIRLALPLSLKTSLAAC